MPTVRYREEDSGSGTSLPVILLGAMAGFAVGMLVAQRLGGFGGLASRLRRSAASVDDGREDALYETAGEGFFDEEADDELEDELEDDDEGAVAVDDSDDDDATNADGPVLERRVLEAFTNDPVLAERAIDIGAVGDGDIELEGWVDDDSEAELAVTIAKGVPGVRSVANHLMVDE